MDFIERWFHVSPDTGNGATEVTYLVAAVAALLILTSLRRQLASFARRCTDLFRKSS
jgi:hypothetical protein